MQLVIMFLATTLILRPYRLADDPELLRLVQEISHILDTDKRAETAKKLYQRLKEESYELLSLEDRTKHPGGGLAYWDV
jgi:hypothetical protein